MRTAAEIFDDVMDRWDELERSSILNTPYPGDRGEVAMHHHEMIVRKLQDEFREALWRPCEHGHGEVCREPMTCEEEAIPLSRPEQALADANPSTYHQGAAPEPDVTELMEALKASLRAAGPRGHESITERSERLARRYTNDDGSAK